jgi:hypothetical protein
MRFLIAFAIGSVLGAIAWVGAFYALLGVPTDRSAGIAAAYEKKREVARAVEGPCVYLVGGSGVLMGVDSEKLSEAIGRDVVNFGVYAGLNLDYQLRQVLPYVGEGDVALLSFEYSISGTHRELDPGTRDYVVERDAAYFRSLPISDQLSAMFKRPPGSYYEWVAGSLLALAERERRYPTERINSYGDQTINRVQPAEDEPSEDTPDRYSPIGARFVDRPYAIQLLTAFRTEVESQGGTVLATFPGTLRFDQYDEPKHQRAFEAFATMYEESGIDVLGSPSDFMLGRSAIYDTVYHLNAVGVEKRTQTLIPLLKAYLSSRETR